MSNQISQSDDQTRSGRLSKAQRKQQLLDTALLIVREEGADRLTLANLAARAGISKPVVYDHFDTRSALLIELYRWIDHRRVNTFRATMASGEHSYDETVVLLATAYIHCAADMTDEFHIVGAALAGSEEKAAVYQELLNLSVQMFGAVLQPFVSLPPDDLTARCTGLVGAGEALSAAVVRHAMNEDEAVGVLALMISGSMATR